MTPRALIACALLLFGGGNGERVAAPKSSSSQAGVGMRPGARHLLPTMALLMAPAGVDSQSPQVPSTEERFERLDVDGDGRLDWDEFSAHPSEYLGLNLGKVPESGWLQELYERLFAEADMDGDGYLSTREMAFAELIGTPTIRWRVRKRFSSDGVDGDFDEFGSQHAKDVMRSHDLDGDGLVSRSEYDDWIRASAGSSGWQSILDDPDVLKWLDFLFLRCDVNEDRTLNQKEALCAALLSDKAFRSDLFRDKRMAADADGQVDRPDGAALKVLADAGADRDKNLDKEVETWLSRRIAKLNGGL